MFIKNFISLSLILSFSLIADDHSVKIESDGTVGEFNYVTVTDPINFMMALDAVSYTHLTLPTKRIV